MGELCNKWNGTAQQRSYKAARFQLQTDKVKPIELYPHLHPLLECDIMVMTLLFEAYMLH